MRHTHVPDDSLESLLVALTRDDASLHRVDPLFSQRPRARERLGRVESRQLGMRHVRYPILGVPVLLASLYRGPLESKSG
jgi:hypothetical protein